MPGRSLLLPLLLAAGLQIQGAVFASPTPAMDVRDWLQHMIHAVHTLDYEGTFVYLHDNHLETMRVIHTAGDEGEMERLLSLNGHAREVVRDNASVTCVAPESRSVSVGSRIDKGGFRAVFSMDVESLAAHYDFKLLQEARIAERPAQVVAILPKDGFRYGYRIYLDKSNFLPLRTDMLDVDGRAVSQVMFTELRVGDTLSGIGLASMDGREDYRWQHRGRAQPIKSTSNPGWRFDGLPSGFVLSLHTRRKSGPAGGELDHFVFSDGLESLSVYIEQASAGAALRGASQMGAVNAFGREIGGNQVTVIGQVPALAVQQIATTIQPSVRR